MALDLPDSPRKLIFRTLVSLFQSDTDLKRTIQPGSWFTWDGKLTSNTPFATALLPAVQLTPLGMPASTETNVSQNSPFAIQLVVATQGLNVDDLFDLWSAFESPIFPGDGSKNAVIACMNAIRANVAANPTTSGAYGTSIQSLRLGQPGITLDLTDAGQNMMIGTGTILVQMLVLK